MKEIEDFVKAACSCEVDERFCFISREVPQFALQMRGDHVVKVYCPLCV